MTCRELAYRMLAHCNFCPWNRRVDRMAATKFAPARFRFAGQLAFSSHRRGALLPRHWRLGTIFFTSCNMRCAFCQNGDISTDKDNDEETDPAHARSDGMERCAVKAATTSIGSAARW